MQIKLRVISLITVLLMACTFSSAFAMGAGVEDVAVPEEIAEYFDSACLVELNSNTVLFAKEPDKPFMPVGSAVNLMAAYTVAQEMDMDGELTAPDEIDSISSGARNIGLTKGNIYTVRDLLIGMIIAGAQDAAVALAHGAAGSEEAFLTLMNQYAAGLGMTGTVYYNARGGNDTNQTTTVKDYITLCSAILSNQAIAEPATRKQYTMADGTKIDHRLDIMNPETDSYDERVQGLGDGATDRAGINIALVAEQDGMKLLFAGHKMDGTRGDCESNAMALMEHYWSNCSYVDVSGPVAAMISARELNAENVSISLLASNAAGQSIQQNADGAISLGELYEGVNSDGEPCKLVDVFYRENLLTSIEVREPEAAPAEEIVESEKVPQIPVYTMDDWKGKDKDPSLVDKYGFYIIAVGTVMLAAAVLSLVYGLRRKSPRR